MISEIAQSCSTRTESTDPDAASREEFLQVLARLDLDPAQAIPFVEDATGRPFETCSATQLLALLRLLLEILRAQLIRVDASMP